MMVIVGLMRPALRLLKRPSALPIIDCLISPSSSIGSLHERTHRKCSRCLSSASPNPDLEAPEPRPRKDKVTPITTSFPVPPSPQPERNAYDGGSAHFQADKSLNWKQLGLDVERLEYESDIGHIHDIGTRLIDDPVHRHDFDLWLELLRYRQRHYGDAGTLEIWKGFVYRVGGLQLPVDGESADIFWESFVSLGLRDTETKTVLNQVVDHASEVWNETGKRWPKLYRSIVGTFVQRGLKSEAVKWHERLRTPHLSKPNDIVVCFAAALSDYDQSEKAPENWRARMSAFRAICRRTRGHQIWGQVIPALLANSNAQEVVNMHHFLIGRGDHPLSEDEFRPLLKYTKLFSSRATRERLQQYFEERFSAAGHEVDLPVPSEEEKLQELNELDPLESIERNGFNDGFGARIFATRALGFEMIVAGLKTFNVRAIGPQSLREMARRAHGSRDVLEMLDRLEEKEISVGDSMFARLLRKFATEGRSELLEHLVHSDQHHDVFEDAETQASLMVSSYASYDWRQYNLSATILTELLGGGYDMLNLNVQKHIAAGEKDLAVKAITQMLLQGHKLDKATNYFLELYLLGPRKPGRRAVQQPNLRASHSLDYAFKFLQKLSMLGAEIPVNLWIELLKRFAMEDWVSLRKCCLWLARRYSDVHPHPASTILGPGTDKLYTMQLFDTRMQETILTAGWIIHPPSKLRSKRFHVTAPNGERLVPFARGLLLLRELRTKGIDVRRETVHRICRLRLVQLYGPPIESSRPRNRAMRQENPFTAEQVVAHLNNAWGGDPLFDEKGKEQLAHAFKTRIPNLNRQRSRDRFERNNTNSFR